MQDCIQSLGKRLLLRNLLPSNIGWEETFLQHGVLVTFSQDTPSRKILNSKAQQLQAIRACAHHTHTHTCARSDTPRDFLCKFVPVTVTGGCYAHPKSISHRIDRTLYPVASQSQTPICSHQPVQSIASRFVNQSSAIPESHLESLFAHFGQSSCIIRCITILNCLTAIPSNHDRRE